MRMASRRKENLVFPFTIISNASIRHQPRSIIMISYHVTNHSVVRSRSAGSRMHNREWGAASRDIVHYERRMDQQIQSGARRKLFLEVSFHILMDPVLLRTLEISQSINELIISTVRAFTEGLRRELQVSSGLALVIAPSTNEACEKI